jgi:hypothetical protein
MKTTPVLQKIPKVVLHAKDFLHPGKYRKK